MANARVFRDGSLTEHIFSMLDPVFVHSEMMAMTPKDKDCIRGMCWVFREAFAFQAPKTLNHETMLMYMYPHKVQVARTDTRKRRMIDASKNFVRVDMDICPIGPENWMNRICPGMFWRMRGKPDTGGGYGQRWFDEIRDLRVRDVCNLNDLMHAIGVNEQGTLQHLYIKMGDDYHAPCTPYIDTEKELYLSKLHSLRILTLDIRENMEQGLIKQLCYSNKMRSPFGITNVDKGNASYLFPMKNVRRLLLIGTTGLFSTRMYSFYMPEVTNFGLWELEISEMDGLKISRFQRFLTMCLPGVRHVTLNLKQEDSDKYWIERTHTHALGDWKSNRWSVGELVGTMQRMVEGSEWSLGLDTNMYDWANLFFDDSGDEVCLYSDRLLIALQTSNPTRCIVSPQKCCKDSKGFLYCTDGCENEYPTLYEVCALHMGQL